MRDQLARQRALLSSSINLPDGGRRLATRIQQLEAELAALAAPHHLMPPSHPSVKPIELRPQNLHAPSASQHVFKATASHSADVDTIGIDLTGPHQHGTSKAHRPPSTMSAAHPTAPANHPGASLHATHAVPLPAGFADLAGRPQDLACTATPIIDMTSPQGRNDRLPDTVMQPRQVSRTSALATPVAQQAQSVGAIDLTEEGSVDRNQAPQQGHPPDSRLAATVMRDQVGRKHTGQAMLGASASVDGLTEQLQQQLSLSSQQGLHGAQQPPTHHLQDRGAGVGLEQAASLAQPASSQPQMSTGREAGRSRKPLAERTESQSASRASVLPHAPKDHPPPHDRAHAPGSPGQQSVDGSHATAHTKQLRDELQEAPIHESPQRHGSQPLCSITNLQQSLSAKQLPQKPQQSSSNMPRHPASSSCPPEQPAAQALPAHGSTGRALSRSSGDQRKSGLQLAQGLHPHGSSRAEMGLAGDGHDNGDRGHDERAGLEAEAALLKHKLLKYCAILSSESKRAQLPDGGLQVMLRVA